MLTRLSIKFMLLFVLMIIPAACSMTNNPDKNDDQPAMIPTSVAINTQPVLIVTSTPQPTVLAQPTNTPQPTLQPVAYQPCTVQAGWFPYRVMAGDTLSKIAQRAGTTTDQLTRGNCLSNPNNIDVGELIYTPRAVVTVTPYVTPTCTLMPRLSSSPGSSGRVTPGLANALRSLPGRSSASVVLAEIPGGGVFAVLGGPQCADGFYWWQVNYNGVVGWTAEGQGSTYWLEPVTSASCWLTPRLYVGGQGRVLPGLSNALRSQPGTGSGSVVISEIPGGGVFSVIGGTQCVDGYHWWQVNYNGVTGWTAEGQGSTYWLEPVTTPTCSPVPRLSNALGAVGRVTPGLPNSLRTQPGRGSNSVVIGQIPGGGVFNIVGGPQCADDSYWWQVNYNGAIGWTAEGQGNTYWLEPITSTQ